MKNCTLAQIAHHLSIQSTSQVRVRTFAIDSRKVEPGALFFALPGEKVDGHLFLEEVAKKGAVAAIVSKQYSGAHYGLDLLAVEDVKQALQHLGQISAAMHKGRRIAVTGSVGKTTTKEFLVAILKARFSVGYTEGNSNSQVSFPLFWLNIEGEYDLFVVEMGMWHAGEIRRLVEIAPPDIALVTAIAPAHICFFAEGITGIARAKGEIFSHPRTEQGFVSSQAFGFAPIREAIESLREKWVYGEGGDFGMKVEGESIVIEETKSHLFSPRLQTSLKGAHLLENALGAAGVARVLGLSWEEIAPVIATLKPHPLRYEMEKREGVTFVKDCYNANPLTMRIALTNLPSPEKGGRRIGVLGAMAEQGALSASHHREVGQVALQHLDELFCIGKESMPMVEAFQEGGGQATYFQELSLLKAHLFQAIGPGDVVLIKGSNFLQLWHLMDP
jgi:UDP-N-acetylmuramoyl-tripeptide--D-alanyl-D-alanine ligase